MKISKNIKSILRVSLFVGAGLMTLSSCSDNEPMENGLQDNESGFLQLSLSLPSTRSTINNDGSSSEGTENAYGKESSVESIKLIFCKAGTDADNDSYVSVLESSSNPVSNTAGNIITVKVPVDYKDFATKFAGQKVTVYAVANADITLDGNSPKTWKLKFNDFNSNGLGVWTSPDGKAVPLVNAERSGVIDFSGNDYQAMKALFNDQNGRVYHLSEAGLGTLKMERAVARFDYKGSNNNVYPLGESGMFVKIAMLQPVNVSKEAYLFRHTSAGNATEATGDARMFGNENGGDASAYTWISDTDWATKTAGAGPAAGYFINQPSVSNGVVTLTGSWSDTESITSEANNTSNSADNGYHAWCYISENTLPSTATMIEGLSTGVAFRAILCDEDGKALTKAQLLNTNASWAWTLSFSENGDNLSVSNLKDGSRVLQKIEGQDAYALVYFYWNRHNDVAKELSTTDPMEFAVVRNHIYKISITGINTLPRIYDPTAKDELVAPQNQDFTVAVALEEWGYNQVEMDI